MPQPLSSSARQILLVDDSPLLRSMVGDILTAAGYAVCDAASAEEGLELFNQRDIGLVITDLNLGAGLNGGEFLNRLSALRPSLKAILLTGSILPGQSVRYRFPVLAKPFTSQDLLKLVSRVLLEGPPD